MVPVVSDDNKIMGVVTEGNLMACLLNGRVQPEDVVESVMYKQFKKVSAQRGRGAMNDKTRIIREGRKEEGTSIMCTGSSKGRVGHRGRFPHTSEITASRPPVRASLRHFSS